MSESASRWGGFAVQSSHLSPEQERELIAAAEGGDEAACRELVELFLPAIGDSPAASTPADRCSAPS